MIPSATMDTEAVVELYEGNSSLGAVYGEKSTVRGRFEGKRRQVKRPDGTEIICSGTLKVRPDVDVTMQSRVTIADRRYIVQEILPGEGLRRTEYLELLLS